MAGMNAQVHGFCLQHIGNKNPRQRRLMSNGNSRVIRCATGSTGCALEEDSQRMWCEEVLDAVLLSY